MGKRLLKLCFMTSIAGAAAFSAAAARAQVLPNPMDFGVMYEQLAFEAADTDGNNLVSEAEFARDAAAAFAGLDANRDGKLTSAGTGPPHCERRRVRSDRRQRRRLSHLQRNHDL